MVTFDSPKKLGWALLVSLALNLFLAGAITAHLLKRERGPGPRQDLAAPGFLLRAARSMDADGRAQVREVLQRHRAELRPHRRKLDEARLEVHDALAAEPFRRKRLEEALTRLRSESSSSQLLVHQAIADLAETLPPEQRRKLAKASGRVKRGRPPR